MKIIRVKWPEEKNKLLSLPVGSYLLVTGQLLTARDQAHKRLVAMIEAGENLPIDLPNSLIYYCGPTSERPGSVIGSCGPTTSSRMDVFLPILLKAGLSVTMGKGFRTEQAVSLIKKSGAGYLVTIGGAGAYLSQFVKKKQLIAFPELGPEAIYKLTVVDFPAYKYC